MNPPSSREILESHTWDRGAYEQFVGIKRIDSLSKDYVSTLRHLDVLIESGGRALFDVGAGAGEFLHEARLAGFDASGNEVAPGAIEMAKDLRGIQMHPGELATVEGADLFDAVTMWCVIAHTADPDGLMRDTLRVLKPGGVLFLRTPRWSAMDTGALWAARVTGGRLARVLDQRVTAGHMTLNSRRGLTAQARRLGFDVVEAHRRARYGVETPEYLNRMGMSARMSAIAARPLDVAVERGLFFRNVLDLYARKPVHS
jgi:2-polyprenyl-3-methyl-5-hydroxy-6-metoxy-1,4-benzoquinol methylase